MSGTASAPLPATNSLDRNSPNFEEFPCRPNGVPFTCSKVVRILFIGLGFGTFSNWGNNPGPSQRLQKAFHADTRHCGDVSGLPYIRMALVGHNQESIIQFGSKEALRWKPSRVQKRRLANTCVVTSSAPQRAFAGRGPPQSQECKLIESKVRVFATS